MNPSSEQIKATLKEREDHLRKLRFDFMMQNVPRFHRFLIDVFPNLRHWFNYGLAAEETDPTKLTLVRGSGKKLKVVARNF